MKAVNICHIISHIKNPKIVITIVATGVIFLYLLFNWVISAAIHSRKEVIVPELSGKSLAEAVNTISSFNLGIRKEGEEFDRSVPAGTVLRQNPPGGMAVREGKIIRITLSQGGEVIFVPDVAGQPARTAEIAIRSSGLNLGEESSKFSVVTDKGRVISQDPPAGSTAEKDSLINLVISQGPPAEGVILAPQWAGKNVDDVKLWAEKNHITVETRDETIKEALPGTIVRQDPVADSDISISKTITVFVAVAQGTGAQSTNKTFHFEVPQGSGDRQIRLTIIDENGEKEIFNGKRASGSKLEIPVSPIGKAKVRVFIDNMLSEEREVE